MTSIEPAAAAVSYGLHQEVVARRRTIERDFLALGAVLARIRDERHFEALGCESFEAYIAGPDVNIPHTTAFRLLRVHDLAVLRGWTSAAKELPATPIVTEDELIDMGSYKADMVRRRILDAQTPEERQRWIGAAIGNSPSDLRKELAAGRGLDIDAGWREPLEYAARRLHALAGQLSECAGAERALGILDEVCATSMQARARLEREP